jgi:hypothetical protein
MTDPLQEEVTEVVTTAEDLEEDQATEVEVEEEEEEDTAAEMVEAVMEEAAETVDVEEDVQKAAAEDTTAIEKIKLGGLLLKDIAPTAKAAVAAQLDCNSITYLVCLDKLIKLLAQNLNC